MLTKIDKLSISVRSKSPQSLYIRSKKMKIECSCALVPDEQTCILTEGSLFYLIKVLYLHESLCLLLKIRFTRFSKYIIH